MSVLERIVIIIRVSTNTVVNIGDKILHFIWHSVRFIDQGLYKVVQIWPGLFLCKQLTLCPGHIWTTL
jgi:hypothetical protein